MRGEPIPHSRPTLVPGLEAAIGSVIASGQHAGGAVRRAFETAVARRVGVPEAVAVQTGLAALHLSLLALGVERGQKVLVPSYVCAALLHAVDAVGATPVVADVDPRFFNLTPETARAALRREGLDETQVACAIVPHILGYPAPLHLWDLSVPVVEDCAMALGAQIREEDVGSYGQLSIFSFYATKMLSTGQGGMVLTANAALAAEARDLITYDNRESWRPCWNYPLPDVAAALGAAQLPHLDEFLQQRTRLAVRYRTELRSAPVTFQDEYPETTSSCFRFVVLLPDRAERDRVQADLAAAGVETKAPVFRPLHQYLDLPAELFPGTESVYARALSLPIYPSLTHEEQDRVVGNLRESVGA